MRAIAALLMLSLASIAHAQDAEDAPPPIEVTLTRWTRYDGVDRPYRFILAIRAREPVTVITDRRLLTLEVTPREGRRRYRCADPAAPRRSPEARARSMSPSDPPYKEWIDLRMYCWGAALRALEGGAEVVAHYGYTGRSRTRWIARRGEGGALEHRVGVAQFAFEPIARAEETVRLDEADAPVRARVALAPTSARTGGALVLRPAIFAREGSARAFARPTDWTFRVRGPLGEVACAIDVVAGVPPLELYRRITERSGIRESLDADQFCPAGTFEPAGIYEITPEVLLEHSGEEYDLDAVTGRFAGPVVPIRITHGERGYVEQVPERAPVRE